MGIAKEPNIKPQITMENRTSKAISIIKSLFHSKKKDKLKLDTPKPETQNFEKPNPVDSVLETFKALELNNDKKPKQPINKVEETQNKKEETQNKREEPQNGREETQNKRSKSQDRQSEAQKEKEETQNKREEPQNGREETQNKRSKSQDRESRTQNKIEETHKPESETEEDEFSHFTFKVVEEDRRSARIDSHSSEDSGFSDVKEDDQLIETFQGLNLEEAGEKKKKLQTVVVSRGPERIKLSDYCAHTHPYGKTQEDRTLINQVNKTALCGGNVTVNSTPPQPDSYVVDIALKEVEILSQNSQNESEYWQDLMEVISADTKKPERNTEIRNFEIDNSEFTTEFDQQTRIGFSAAEIQKLSEICTLNTESQSPEYQPEIPIYSSPDYQTNQSFEYQSPIDEFNSHLESPTFSNLPNYEDTVELTSIINLDYPEITSTKDVTSIFPTPPRSENVPSPMSESQTFYPTNCPSDYTLSPERSSPYNSDFERYQEIVTDFEVQVQEKKERKSSLSTEIQEKKERKNSLSNLTLKNFKDMQKELANGFSKKDCCVLDRKSCKEIFDGHMSKLKTVERKNLCIKVSKLDLKTCYGVLQNILINLSREDVKEDPLQMALFALVCQKVLVQAPALFVGDFGVNVLKSSALRCPHVPHLTRVVVDCVYSAVRAHPTLCTKDYVFHEVDGQGDNLVVACARGGDTYALVLAEITRTDERRDLPPLFRLEHVNCDGHTALHVACGQHSATSSRLHTVHVLLDHAGADLWKGDVKGGDTPLHLAVNSPHCDLNLVLLLFRHIDRNMWKRLAHSQNMSSVTPLEYARSATRSTTRQNYPQEVLSFLMKCR